MTFIYGAEGVIGFMINGISYLYRKNLFGDVTEIYNETRQLVGKYSYTAFGECTVEVDVGQIATKNPIRYRSYYYDEEINLYYLHTRYYDPEIGRFMTIDDIQYISADTINGLNLYAYCANNPVMRLDPTGNSFALLIFGIFLVVSLFTLTYSSSDSNDKKVYYDVPLYSQGGLNLCWAYCQVMVEAYQSNTKLTQKEADAILAGKASSFFRGNR